MECKSWPHNVNYCYQYQLGTVFVNGMEPVALILNQILTKEKGNDLLGAEKAYDCDKFSLSVSLKMSSKQCGYYYDVRV